MWKTVFAAAFLLLGITSFAQSFTSSGEASHYADKYNGSPTRSEEPYDINKFTAAIREYRGTKKNPGFFYLLVTNQANGKQVVVKVNDRLANQKRAIDLSHIAAEQIGAYGGLGQVDIELYEMPAGGDIVAINRALVSGKSTSPVTAAPVPVSGNIADRKPAKIRDLPKLKVSTGLASYYSDEYQGMKTKSGAVYNRNELTAAHKTLPFGTRVRVTRTDNNRSTIVRIIDRGPRAKDRVIDVSGAAAEQLGMIGDGLVNVRLEVLPAEGTTVAPTLTAKSPTTAPATTTVVKTTIAPTRIANTDLYEIEMRPKAKAGYGVQVAYLSTYESAVEMVNQLQGQLDEKVLLSVKQNATSGKEEYRVIVGSLATREQATTLKMRLKTARKMDGFVVALANM